MRTGPLAALLLTLGFTSCGDSSVAAIRVVLAPDMSGTVTTTSLLVPDSPGPLEGRTDGVTWGERANLYSARGSFEKVSDLRIADITFEVIPDANFVKVVLPRGEVEWPGAFTPARADRERVIRTFDPNNTFGGATTHLTLSITLPGTAVGSNVSPKARGIASDATGRTATLVIPVDRGTDAGDAFEWHVTWK